jgi:hypothetical protein
MSGMTLSASLSMRKPPQLVSSGSIWAMGLVFRRCITENLRFSVTNARTRRGACAGAHRPAFAPFVRPAPSFAVSHLSARLPAGTALAISRVSVQADTPTMVARSLEFKMRVPTRWSSGKLH